LQSAGQDEVSILDSRRSAAALEQTMAGAVIVDPQMQARVPSSVIAIVTVSAYEGWACVAALVHPVPPTCPGIHPSALVHPDAQVDASAEIGPYAVVESRAKIGPDSRIGSFVSIGAASAKAARSVYRPALFPMSMLAPCRLGVLRSRATSSPGKYPP
jgi:UDP-3-O-[3-hydroxymyristoyl] glucosamine N-acyltransferase